MTIIFGVGDHRNGQIIGNHNELIDMLARYGIIGALIVYKIFYWIISNIKKNCGFNNHKLFIQSLLIFVAFFFRNIFGSSLSSMICVLVTIMLPIICEDIGRENDVIGDKL